MAKYRFNNNNDLDFESFGSEDLKLHKGCANKDNAVAGIEEKDFTFFHSIDKNVVSSHFKLHTHDNHMEILMFLAGNADFHIEGNVYNLEPGDILLVQPNELHRVVHKTPGYYERIAILINTRFFFQNECSEFKGVFINRIFGENNLIRHGSVENAELTEIIKRMERYITADDRNSMVIKNTLIEFLYVLNRQNHTEIKDLRFDNNIRNIVVYINNHLLEDFDLEKIADKFFMSKYHLCRIFKKHTGFTVNQYVTHKRLLRAKELYESGMSLSSASQRSGFKSYSNFYRAYLKEIGEPPKRNLKNQNEL